MGVWGDEGTVWGASLTIGQRSLRPNTVPKCLCGPSADFVHATNASFANRTSFPSTVRPTPTTPPHSPRVRVTFYPRLREIFAVPCFLDLYYGAYTIVALNVGSAYRITTAAHGVLDLYKTKHNDDPTDKMLLACLRRWFAATKASAENCSRLKPRTSDE